MVQIDPHALLRVRARNGRESDREGTAPSARSVGARRRKLDERPLERRADVLRGRRAARERVGGRLSAVVVVRVGVAVVLQLVQLAARAVGSRDKRTHKREEGPKYKQGHEQSRYGCRYRERA